MCEIEVRDMYIMCGLYVVRRGGEGLNSIDIQRRTCHHDGIEKREYEH